MEQLLDELAKRVAEMVAERVIGAMKSIDAGAVRELPFCYSEAEAAEILKCSPQTLAARRKEKEIDYAIAPSGRPVYMPHHILNYLLGREVNAAGKKRPLKAADVLRFPIAA